MKLKLVHPTIPSETAWVEWDEAAGEVTGGMAAHVITRRAGVAAAAGTIVAPPYPTSYDIGREPLKSRRDLALIISTHWLVPEELVASLPAAADAEDDADVEVLY